MGDKPTNPGKGWETGTHRGKVFGTHIHTHNYTYIFIYVHVYVCVSKCIRIYIYIYVCMMWISIRLQMGRKIRLMRFGQVIDVSPRATRSIKSVSLYKRKRTSDNTCWTEHIF